MNTGKPTYPFRVLGLMHVLDKLKYVYFRVKNKTSNNHFLKTNPHVKLPPDYIMFESFQLILYAACLAPARPECPLPACRQVFCLLCPESSSGQAVTSLSGRQARLVPIAIRLLHRHDLAEWIELNL